MVDADEIGSVRQIWSRRVVCQGVVEIGIQLSIDHRVGKPAVVEVVEFGGRFLIGRTGRVGRLPRKHVEHHADLGVRPEVELVNCAVRRRVRLSFIDEGLFQQVST